MIVATRHAFGDAGGPRSPADGEDIVGVDLGRGAVCQKLLGSRRFFVKIEGVGGRVGAKSHQLVCAAQQRANDADMIRTLHHSAAYESFGLDNAEHRRQLMAPILNSDWTDDGADCGSRKIERNKFADIGQLDDDHIILSNSGGQERSCKALNLCLHLGISQPSRLAKGEVRPVGCIDQSKAVWMLLGVGKEQVSERLIAPPACLAIQSPLVLSSDDHVRPPAQCSAPCRYHHHWPRPNVCQNRSVREE